MCKTKAGTKCGSGFRLPGGNCDKVLKAFEDDCDDGMSSESRLITAGIILFAGLLVILIIITAINIRYTRTARQFDYKVLSD